MASNPIRIATRGSPLARRQAEHVAHLLEPRQAELVVVETSGDLNRDLPIHEIGGQGVFVKEVQRAVLDDRADLAVHSAKDLESRPTEGLVLAAIPERGDPRDGYVGALPYGGTVATGSVRRRALLSARRPDLDIVELRGNMHTRLEKVGEVDAVIVAVAALDRLGLRDRLGEPFDPDEFVPQVGQGALAVEASEGGEVAEMVAAIDDEPSRLAVTAERSFLAELGGSCDLPAGAYATVDGPTITLRGFAVDDGEICRVLESGSDPVELGQVAARALR